MNLSEASRMAIALMGEHGLAGWKFEFDGALRRFGVCNHSRRLISLSQHLVALNSPERVRQTILHEIAHALVGPSHGHDSVWRLKARQIGCPPRRCYDETDTVTAAMKYTATCPNCRGTHQRMRLPRRPQACAPCCRRHSRGRFDARFIIQYTANVPGRVMTPQTFARINSHPAADAAAHHEQETSMSRRKKTTAAAEKIARESRGAKKAPAKSKAAREALAGAAALKRNADAAERGPLDPKDARGAEILKAREMGIELADDEFLTRPEDVPEGHKVKKYVSRDGRKLAAPVYKVVPAEESKPSAAAESPRRRKKAADSGARDGWAATSVEGERAKAVLAKLQKGTREKPVLAAKELNDHERHLARRLFGHGLIRRDKFEQGIGYFA